MDVEWCTDVALQVQWVLGTNFCLSLHHVTGPEFQSTYAVEHIYPAL